MLRRLVPVPLLALLLALAPSGAAAQQVTVRGTVVDRGTGAPVAGAEVAVEGRRERAVVNARGEFAVRLAAGPHVLHVRAMGYGDATVRVDAAAGAPALRVELAPDPLVLEGIVVVADRFELRRKAVGTTSLVLPRRELALTHARHLAEFVGRHVRGGPPADCQQRTLHLGSAGIACSRAQRSGPTSARARVYVDEMPIAGGLEVLQNLDPRDFDRVEIYEGGRQVRVYTVRFMERAARVRFEPQPISL